MVHTQKVLVQFCPMIFFTIANLMEVREVMIDGNAMQTQVQVSKSLGYVAIFYTYSSINICHDPLFCNRCAQGTITVHVTDNS